MRVKNGVVISAQLMYSVEGIYLHLDYILITSIFTSIRESDNTLL